MNIWSQIAQLARLKFSSKEEESIVSEVSKIIQYFDNISKIPTESVQPLISPTQTPLPLRKDVIQTKECSSDTLLQQSNKQGNYVKVPLVVSTESNHKED